MKECKISIIIPTYNRAWCIENAINSVINQKYTSWELFVIDDGSSDNTEEVVNKYISNKIHYYYKTNSGKSPSVNYGIDNLISKDSDLLFILDSDDEFLTGILDDVNKKFIQNNEIVSFHYKGIFPKWIKDRKSELISKNKKSIIINYNDIITGKSHKGDFVGFINIHKLGNIRFEEKCPNGMENILWLRLAKVGNSLYVNKPLYMIDSSRKPLSKRDNLTSYHSIYKRAKGMIKGYDILIQENIQNIIQIDKNILSKWYIDQFQWCIVDRQLRKGFISWKYAITNGTIKNKLKILLFGVLLMIPKKLLPYVLNIYYKIKAIG